MRAIVVLSLVGFAIIHYLGVNTAHWDDHALKAYILHFQKHGLDYEIFNFHNEHRIVLTRIVAAALVKITGFLDFKDLMYVGWSLLIFAAAVSTYILKNKWWTGVAIGLAFLGLHTEENLLWGMASVQNFGVIAVSVAAFWAVSKQKLGLGLVISLLSLGVSANGIVAVIAVLIFILWNKPKDSIPFAIVGGVILYFYFVGYEPTQHAVNEPITAWKLIKAFILFSGSVIELHSTYIKWLYAIIGLFNIVVSLFVVYQYLIKKKTDKDHFRILLLLFVWGTLAATTLSRLGFGIDTLFTSKYRIYPMILWAICLLFVLEDKWAAAVLLVISLFNFNAEWSQLRQLKKDRITEFYEAHISTNSLKNSMDFIKLPPELIYLSQLKEQKTKEIVTLNNRALAHQEPKADFYLLKNSKRSYLLANNSFDPHFIVTDQYAIGLVRGANVNWAPDSITIVQEKYHHPVKNW